MGIIQFTVISLLIEAIVETLKMTWDEDKINKSRIAALIVSFICCFAFKIDLFNYIGFETTLPIVSYLLTSIIVSREANVVSDILQKLKGIKKLGDE